MDAADMINQISKFIEPTTQRSNSMQQMTIVKHVHST